MFLKSKPGKIISVREISSHSWHAPPPGGGGFGTRGAAICAPSGPPPTPTPTPLAPPRRVRRHLPLPTLRSQIPRSLPEIGAPIAASASLQFVDARTEE
ncbi:hypothetical protein NL676_018908 [Syzygium grande]|nr:hypothetical protein NL676_018908 [Syzygium grande]